jgi:adenylate cyclase
LDFRFNEFGVDVARRELWRASAVVHLEPQVFDLLVLLIRNRNRIVGKDELIDTIWEGRIVSEATISSRISAARRALGDSGNDQTFIRTLYKRGFRFVGDVDGSPAPEAATLAADSEPPIVDTPSSAPDHEGTSEDPAIVAAAPSRGDGQADRDPLPEAPAATKSRPARFLLISAVLIGCVSLGIGAALRPLSSPSVSSARAVKSSLMPTREGDPAADQQAMAPSIVVLPFINLSSDAKQDYVADGVTDSLTGDLARALPGVSVVSRDTAFTYKGRSTDVREIGRDLGVQYALEGSVALEGERVRVNLQLVNAREGGQLWSERFDIERRSILQAQDEIVGRASRAIGLKVVDIEARRSRSERPTSTEVADLVLRGRAVLNLPSSPATMIDARDLFEQALKVDANNVDALAGVATTLVFEFVNGYYETGGDERLQRAEQLLDHASAIEPLHLMVLKAKAALRRTQGRFNDAIDAAQAIIMENPGEPWAYKEIGLSTMYLGEPEPALEWFAKADRIGPRDPGRWTWLDGRGHALILLGRDDEAVRALTGALDANSRNVSSRAFLAAAYALLGRSDDAHAALATYLQSYPNMRVSTFRRASPVPLVLTSLKYQQQHRRLAEGLRQAGMAE